MPRRSWTCLLAAITLWGIVSFLPVVTLARDTEDQLLARVRDETNPVRRAKLEIKLADLKLEQAQDAYDQGKTESGAKLLGAFLQHVKASWKVLRDSGRRAAKQPQGFKELDISLREDIRLLEDLGRRVAYFDRGPVEKAAKEAAQVRAEVLQALFPASKSPATSPPTPKKSYRPEASPEMR